MSPARNREQSIKEKSAFDLELASLKAEHNSEIAELQQKHDTLREAALSIATQLDDDEVTAREHEHELEQQRRLVAQYQSENEELKAAVQELQAKNGALTEAGLALASRLEDTSGIYLTPIATVSVTVIVTLSGGT